MNHTIRRALIVSSAAALVAGVMLPGSPVAWAQKGKSLKDQLIGSWEIVSNYQQYEGGKKANIFSETPKGNVIFDRDGRFSFQLYNPKAVKFASNNRMEGTPDEYKAAGQRTIAYYGTYTVDEKEGKLTYNIEYCSFPNWEGTKRTATITVKGDEFRQTSAPIPSSKGTFVPHLVWKRSK